MYRKITTIRSLVFGFLVCLLLFTVAGSLSADQRIALADFLVHSENPKYTYLGKGISEMIAVELAKSPDVTLVDRAKRVELMEEMEFALSSLAEDANKQVKIGKMLAADYLVFGEIVDMAPQLLISVRVTGIESGEVVFRDTLTEKAGSYEYISGYFATAILGHFEVKVAGSTEKKTVEKVEKDEEAVVAFSRAIDAYDRKDRQEAKQELKTARRIDPEYEAAGVYLSKLGTVSPKFRVETDYYAPTINPAYLGFLKDDMFYGWWGGSIPPPSAQENGFQQVDDFLFKEYPGTQRAGYSIPLGKRLGLGIEYIADGLNNWIDSPDPYEIEGSLYDQSKVAQWDNGASLSVGYRLGDGLCAGARVQAAYSRTESGEGGTINVAEKGFSYGGAIGLASTLSDGKYILDAQLAYYSQANWYLDEEEQKLKSGTLPLILDGTFVASFLDDRVVGALKGIADIYTDSRGGHALRVIPMAEYWVLPFLSVRGGYEYVHLQQAGSFTIGHGFVAGFSLQIWKLTGNFNYTLRKKPSRQVPGYLISESRFLGGFTYTPGWVTRD